MATYLVLSCLDCSTSSFPTSQLFENRIRMMNDDVVIKQIGLQYTFLFVAKINLWVGMWYLIYPNLTSYENAGMIEELGIVKDFNRNCSLPETDYLNLSSPLHFANTNMIPAIYQTARRGIRFQLCVECGVKSEARTRAIIGQGRVEFFVSNQRDLLDDSIIWHIDPALLTSLVSQPDAVFPLAQKCKYKYSLYTIYLYKTYLVQSW